MVQAEPELTAPTMAYTISRRCSEVLRRQHEETNMSWYTIVWRDATPRRLWVEIPGLGEWLVENDAAIQEKKVKLEEWDEEWGNNPPFRFRFPIDKPVCIRPLCIEMENLEYSVMVEVLPETQAPRISWYDESDWLWHTTDDNGKPTTRTLLVVTQHTNVGIAMDEAKELFEEWFEKVEEFDTKEWRSDHANIRCHYDFWREWVKTKTGLMPPPAPPHDPKDEV
jgi:hypothetical protein